MLMLMMNHSTAERSTHHPDSDATRRPATTSHFSLTANYQCIPSQRLKTTTNASPTTRAVGCRIWRRM